MTNNNKIIEENRLRLISAIKENAAAGYNAQNNFTALSIECGLNYDLVKYLIYSSKRKKILEIQNGIIYLKN